MITRIVKLKFNHDFCREFEDVFKKNKTLIIQQKGCISVDMMKNIHQQNEYFTYSIWQSEDDLNIYRNTVLFNSIWKILKSNFSEKPEAWSLNKL